MSGRPVPEPTGDSEPFWRACRAGRLIVQRCANCQRLQYYPRNMCTECLSERLDWETMSGRGTVYTHSIVHRALNPAFEADLPYVVAVVELDEGVRLISRIVDCTPAKVVIGMTVEVTFVPASDAITLPLFRPARAG